jgi:hypothetical protein
MVGPKEPNGMKVSLLIPGVGFALAGALILAGTAAPARAEGSSTANLAAVDGVVVSETDATATAPGTLVIHPPFGADVTLNFDTTTQFRKAGRDLGTPDEQTGALVPAVQRPTPAWFVHLFAHAYYDKTSLLAKQVSLTAPVPLEVEGVVVAGATTDSLELNDPKRGHITLTVNGDTFLRRAGLPVADASVFQAGDQAQAWFWLCPAENEALRIHGHLPPPQHFEGTLSDFVSDDGGAQIGFDVTHGSGPPVGFTENTSTVVKVDANPGHLTDLKVGQFVSVYYQTGSGGNVAVTVLATSPKPPTTPKPNTGDTGDGHKPPTPPTPKPTVVRPLVVQGVVSAACDGSVFQVTKADSTVVSFAVAANTQFRKSDKPAACTDVTVGLRVYVVYTKGATNTALAVVIIPAPTTGGTK